jgi:membrane-bound metal-dependent hydrolase YbcI (DUF457 family)
MDPLSHIIFGRTLIAVDGRRRMGPGAGAAATLGAIAPDIDAVFMWRGWDVYLRVHEIGTHSVAGSFAIACATAALVYSVTRGARYKALIIAAWIGALSHVTFDLVSGANIRIGWPLLQRRVSVPLIAMADPWLVAICASGAAALWILRARGPTVAVPVIAVITVFLAFKATALMLAVPQWTAATSADIVVHRAVEASWGSLTKWHVFDRTPYALRQWRVDALGNGAALLLTYPLQAEQPIVEASRSLATVRNFLHTHALGFPVTTALESGEIRVLWSDIRYCATRSQGTAERDDGMPISCALWFGGTFNRDGRPLTQIVRVGEWLQTRPGGS